MLTETASRQMDAALTEVELLRKTNCAIRESFAEANLEFHNGTLYAYVKAEEEKGRYMTFSSFYVTADGEITRTSLNFSIH